MICENCEIKHDSSYGSGRFCSSKCARGFSTKEKRQEINERVSKKIKLGFLYLTEEQIKARAEKAKQTAIRNGSYVARSIRMKQTAIERRRNKNFEDLSESARKEIILSEQDEKCNCCKLSEWMEKAIPFALHHKDGNKRNHLRENEEILCFNCHAQTDNFGFKGRTHAEETKKKFGLSFNRRTPGSEPGNLGANPSEPASRREPKNVPRE